MHRRFDILCRLPEYHRPEAILFSTDDQAMVERLALLGFAAFDTRNEAIIFSPPGAWQTLEGQSRLSRVYTRDPRDKLVAARHPLSKRADREWGAGEGQG